MARSVLVPSLESRSCVFLLGGVDLNRKRVKVKPFGIGTLCSTPEIELSWFSSFRFVTADDDVGHDGKPSKGGVVGA